MGKNWDFNQVRGRFTLPPPSLFFNYALLEGITNRLLAEKKLTYDKAMELAQAIESAERDTKQLKAAQATSTPPVYYSSTKRPDHKQKKGKEQSKSTKPQGSPIVCYRCGGAHLATACRFISTVCHACKKRGHLARVCRSRPNLGRQAIAKKAHHLVETEEELELASDEEEAYHMFAVPASLASQSFAQLP